MWICEAEKDLLIPTHGPFIRPSKRMLSTDCHSNCVVVQEEHELQNRTEIIISGTITQKCTCPTFITDKREEEREVEFVDKDVWCLLNPTFNLHRWIY